MLAQAEHFDGLGIAGMLQALGARGCPDPLEALAQPGARAAVAQVLMQEGQPVTEPELEAALVTLEYQSVERRQPRVRAAIADAERRGDFAGASALGAERVELDRRLRELDRRLRELVGQQA